MEAAPGPTELQRLCDIAPWPEHGRGRIWSWSVGALLAAFRLVLAVLAAPVLPVLSRKTSRRLAGLLRRAMGVQVVCNLDRGQLSRLTDGCVVALNHVSVMDLLAVCDQPQACLLIDRDGGAVGNLSFLPLAHAAGAELWRVADKLAFARRFAGWRKNPGGRCLYICPEQTIGNQRGLFRFHSTLLDRGRPVVPLALRLTTPFGVRPDPLMSSKALNFVRLLGMPWVRFELHYLPRTSQAPGEASADFAKRVQQVIADHLGVPATDWSPEDKRALRLELRQARR